MLPFTPTTSEGVLARLFQAERLMINLIFTFYHKNYTRYCSYQHPS